MTLEPEPAPSSEPAPGHDGLPVGYRRPPHNPCTVCARPDMQDIDAALLAGESYRGISRRTGLSLGAVSRHHRNHVGGARYSSLTDRPNGIRQSITVRRAERVAKAALRNLKSSQRGSDPDATKATNGAVTAAARAIELQAEAMGELQRGSAVNLTVTAEARVAVDLRSQAEAMTARDIIAEAERYLAAQLEAGEADACAAVRRLMRMLPSAEVDATQ